MRVPQRMGRGLDRSQDFEIWVMCRLSMEWRFSIRRFKSRPVMKATNDSVRHPCVIAVPPTHGIYTISRPGRTAFQFLRS